MPNPATLREQRLRKTKAQLIDEIDTLEQRAADGEARFAEQQFEPARWVKRWHWSSALMAAGS